MKTTLKTIATLALLAVSMSSFATVKPNPLKAVDSKTIIATYVEVISAGSTDFNKFLFADDFEYSNSANNDKFGKREYLNFLKETKNLQFDCETTYSVLDESGNSCIAKSTMTFDTFTRVDYITLTKTDNSWKVSKVVTTYP